MRITAAVARKPHAAFTIESLELEPPRADEILVRIRSVGLSHTDLFARDGDLPVPLPAVLGREAAGVVEEAGSGVTRLAPGDRVVLTCEGADPAEDGLIERNLSGFRADGSSPLAGKGERIAGRFFGQSSFASFALASERNAVKIESTIEGTIESEVPFPILAALGGDVQVGAGAVINTLRPPAGSSIAVFGAGAAGLGAIMAARLCGCHPIVALDVKASRLELAESLGASHGIDPDGVDSVAAIRAIAGRGTASSVETTGLAAAAKEAVGCLSEGGECVLAGAAGSDSEVSLNLFELRQGRVLRGAFFGGGRPALFVPRLVELYRRGSFPLERMIALYPFADINKAAEDLLSGAAVKAVLVMP